MTPTEVVAEVVRWSGLRTTEASDPALVLAAEAVVAYVEGLPILANRADGAAPWPASVRLGAVMLTARTWRRKDTPTGVASVGDDGSIAYVARFDPDMSRLLGLDGMAVG